MKATPSASPAAPPFAGQAASRAPSRATSRRPVAPRFDGVDLGRPFVPEAFTQLYHTPAYAALNDAQRLRYNQLYGLRTNELFMLFEDGFTRRVITRLRHEMSVPEPLLGERLQQMLDEEADHHRMFLSFNRAVLPGPYRDQRGYFALPSRSEAMLLALLTRRPSRWPFMLWLVLLLEEFSTAFSRTLVAARREHDLAADFVRLHRLHLRDEARHVRLDALLLERLLTPLSATRLRVNGWLFRRLLQELVAPKRSGLRVLQALVKDFPSLAPRLPQMLAEVRALGRDPGLCNILSNPLALPLADALQRRYPAFRPALPGAPAARRRAP